MSLSGFIVIDKPVGPTSHDVVGRVRRLSGVRRVGHAGTLDPLASGVLLVGLGRATRFIEYLVGLPKVYETTIRLGVATTTYDAEGEIVSERPVALTLDEIAAALDAFRGPIRQRVPAFSAVKRDGQPLYKQARRGETPDLPERDVTIYELEMLAWESPDLTLRVAASSGTYIRSLAHDLGQALGPGGHITALRRTAVGEFTVAEAVTLDALTPDNVAGFLRPPELAVAHLPRATFNDEEEARLGNGRRVAAPGDVASGEAAAFGPGGRFLGIVAVEEGEWRPRKMIAGSAE
ncbi:MAG: tRNA pseudouridine(55) synthase TruB [Candidatus Promineofilum sp.]|nr:tRNA pseudouridine(55) synthase TruB [Promineifilum sp.]